MRRAAALLILCGLAGCATPAIDCVTASRVRAAAVATVAIIDRACPATIEGVL
jgi:hypothetical protein